METTLLITEVTTMRDGRVCIAGIDRNYTALRPVLHHHIYKRHLYLSNGHAIYPRAVLSLDLTPVEDVDRPHLEDCLWNLDEPTTFLRETSPESWKNVLAHTAYAQVEELFGTEIQRGENIPAGSGLRSLGTLIPERITNLWHKSHDQRQYQYRLVFFDGTGQQFDIPINDLTLQAYIQRLRHNSFKMDYIETLLVDRFNRGDVYLRLGLTRPWNGWCWLQVTGIYTFPDYLAGKNFAAIEVSREDSTPN